MALQRRLAVMVTCTLSILWLRIRGYDEIDDEEDDEESRKEDEKLEKEKDEA